MAFPNPLGFLRRNKLRSIYFAMITILAAAAASASNNHQHIDINQSLKIFKQINITKTLQNANVNSDELSKLSEKEKIAESYLLKAVQYRQMELKAKTQGNEKLAADESKKSKAFIKLAGKSTVEFFEYFKNATKNKSTAKSLDATESDVDKFFTKYEKLLNEERQKSI